ncbi:hypothetical protein MHU86_9134 [Fragilaria crotonensis]|nr:hypothetical protein MHU86_9134 [Fragilaria crotonensis]
MIVQRLGLSCELPRAPRNLGDTLYTATDVSQPHLQRHAPQFLAINTLESTWTDHIRGDDDVMDIDSTQWTKEGSKKRGSRSKYPPPTPPTSIKAKSVAEHSSTARDELTRGDTWHQSELRRCTSYRQRLSR